METMNQVQWLKISEAEIIELVRCDSIVAAGSINSYCREAESGKKYHMNQNTSPVHMLVGLYLNCLFMC